MCRPKGSSNEVRKDSCGCVGLFFTHLIAWVANVSFLALDAAAKVLDLVVVVEPVLKDLVLERFESYWYSCYGTEVWEGPDISPTYVGTR